MQEHFSPKEKIPNGKHKFLSPSYKSNEYIAEDSDYLNNYRLGYAEFDIDDLKKAKNDKNYELMRVWLNDEHLNNLKIKEFFNTADFIGLKNIKNYRSQVSEKDQPLWDPNIFFSLKKTFTNTFNKNMLMCFKAFSIAPN